ncbi:hypothetical protein VD0004_g6679 [Verticillium dahliae]|uniref:Uncharacterized protein n=1 Tax=Verticillium dahliae TaxID=27337 RepID=A0AA45ANL2_VERDA|nr:hypothetical protein BJF96_g2402 [Verticillium dahliae]PNH40295.1 hypothetical protein VD0004_g6679 [Verticillium dahliae]PNH56951.1 hypothetical protein VD0003_g793 [Verticillium dahliae]
MFDAEPSEVDVSMRVSSLVILRLQSWQYSDD